MDKSQILKRIKNEKNFNTDAELADFLGISRAVLSNWYKRDSIDYDLVLSKCEHMDMNYLLKGIKTEIKQIDNEWLLRRFEEVVSENALLKRENEELITTRGKPANTTNYPEFSTKIGTGIAAEQKK